MARILLYNAKVYVEKGHYEEAVLTDGGRIIKVGRNEDVLKLMQDGDQVIDCKGRTLVPGFNDSHMHMFNCAEIRNQPGCSDAKTMEEIVERVMRFAKENPDAVEGGIYASSGYSRDNFENPENVPTRTDLDRISTDIPVILDSTCLYYRSVNSKVLEMCNITEETEVPEGGMIMLDDSGRPNGVLYGNAMYLVSHIVPEFSLDFYRKILVEIQELMLKCGITSIQSNDIGYSMKPQQKAFELLKDMEEKGELKIRYNSQTSTLSIEDCEEYLKHGEFSKSEYGPDPLVTVGSLKLLRDGNLASKTAMMRNGYSDDPDNHGTWWHSLERVRGICRLAKEYGATVTTHAIGDLAIEEVLDIYEEYFGKENPKRCSIVHCNVTDEALLKRIVENNVPLLMQPAFINTVRDNSGMLYDEKLASTSNALNTLVKLGAHVAYGTDAPVSDVNPCLEIYSAVTRKVWNDPFGSIVYEESEKVDRETAIDAYTIEGAYVEFLEDRKGRIKEGYYADMALLSKDIFTCPEEEIPGIVSEMTIVKGEIVYKK